MSSATNARLRQPSLAVSLALDAVSSNPAARGCRNQRGDGSPQFRVVVGIGPGRSGTKSLNELFQSQPSCVRSDHEMIVPRTLDDRRGKGSWGADRRLEWDPPRRARGSKDWTEEEAAIWRVARLLEQCEEFSGWVCEKEKVVMAIAKKDGETSKPRKLGAQGWREYNESINSDGHSRAAMVDSCMLTDGVPVDKPPRRKKSIVAAVSSSALAYVHEYVTLDPSIRIAVLTRPIEEVVESFVVKTKGRNHWQHRDEDNPIKDKTWDNQFPNMTNEECMACVTNPNTESKPDKAAAIRAYCELYVSSARELARRYPNNVRMFGIAVLNKSEDQDDMLRWCGFDEPLLNTGIRLNRSRRDNKNKT